MTKKERESMFFFREQLIDMINSMCQLSKIIDDILSPPVEEPRPRNQPQPINIASYRGKEGQSEQ